MDRTTHKRGRTAHELAALFEPRSIALVGASEKSLWSQLIFRNYRALDFDGRLFAVNRTGAGSHGLAGYTSCTDIGEPIDVAFIFVPQTSVLEALDDAAAAGVRHVVVLSSGFAEIGASGVEAQARMLERARSLQVRVWGPNSLGFNNISARVPVSVIPIVKPILPPSIAIVTQSGASAAELNEFAHSQNIGTSFVAATGNEADITLADVVDFLVDHAPTKSIAIFAESVRDPGAFERAAHRARAAAKPIVMLKVGRSALAAAVAQAHTGSLAGDDRVFDCICEHLGIVRVRNAEDLINTAGLLAVTGRLQEPGLSFVSISGGACTLVADGAESAGVSLPSYGPGTRSELRKVLSEFGSALNPLDITGAAILDPLLFERVIPIAAAAPSIGLLAINMTVPTGEGQGVPAALAAIGRALSQIDKPAVMVATCNKALNDVSRAAIAENGLPHIITGVEDMLRAVSGASWWSERAERQTRPLLLSQPQCSDGSLGLTTEREILDFLASAGVPVIPAKLARTGAEAAAAAAHFGGTVVLKIASPDIAHKSDVGGVRLDVRVDEAAVAADTLMSDVAARRPDARMLGTLVSPMRHGGVELIVGITRDPTWGLILAVGFGGVLVEMLTDAVLAPLPVDPSQVVGMLARLRGAKLLKGYRGSAPADIEAVADAVVRISEAAIKLGPALQALEVNPLLVRGHCVEALDALVVW